MTRGTFKSEWVRLPSAEARFWGGNRKKVFAFVAKTLFWEEPEKQRAAVPQDAGKTPSVCPSQRRAPTAGVTSTSEKRQSRRTAFTKVSSPVI
jgi:hypothetical protein